MVHKRDSSEQSNLALPANTKRRCQDDEDTEDDDHANESVGTGPITSDPGEQSDGDSSYGNPSAEAESDEDQLVRHLAQAIYNGRPKKIQQRAIDYVVRMKDTPSPRLEEFVRFIRASFPSVKMDLMTREWERIGRFFEEGNTVAHVAIAELTKVSEFVEAFKAAPALNEQAMNVASMPLPLSPLRMPSSSAVSSLSRQSTSVNDGSSSNSGSSGSSKRLTPGQVASLQARFKSNFDDFEGDDWVLPSGAVFDTVLYESVKDLRYECPLHSFVIEDTAAIFDLFPDDRDQAELKKVLIEREDEGLPELSSAEKGFLNLYNLSPEELEEQFAQKSWGNISASQTDRPTTDFQRLTHECLQQLLKVYRGKGMMIPQDAPESWIVNRLWSFIGDALECHQKINFFPGEYCSKASMYRRNLGRPRDVRQFAGHKVDGVAIAAAKELELLVIEAGRKDEGPNTTKALDGRLKLCKLTKDMHDFIRSKSKTNVRERLVTYGIQISGKTATLYSLRQRRGRFYQLCHESTDMLPSVWAEQSETHDVLEVLSTVLVIRKVLLSAVQDASSCMSGLTSHFDRVECDPDSFAATMTSP